MSRRITYDKTLLLAVLIDHQRLETTGCRCGWNEWGASFAKHVIDEYELVERLLVEVVGPMRARIDGGRDA